MSDDTSQSSRFERSLVEFFERVAAQPTEDEKPEVLELLREHFGEDPSAYETVSEQFEAHEHPNLHLSIQAYIANGGRTAELIGVVSERMQYVGIGLAQIVGDRSNGHDAVRRGPVQYVNQQVGPDDVLPCVQLGLYLVREGTSRSAILLRGPARMSYRSSIDIEVMCSNNSLARHVLAEVRNGMRKLNTYRGQVLSLGISQDRTVEVSFHSLPKIERDEIILPDGLLSRIERQTVRFTEHADKLLAAGRHLKRGLLLHGPPGTGKTLTAMYLASRMRNRTVLLLTGRTFGLLDASCRMARALQPAMVVLEDVDLIAEERTREGQCGALLFELLNEMDGLAQDADVLFLLTTNRPDILEPALAARPGRVDLAIEVPLPDASCRQRLFDLYGRGLRMCVADMGAFVARTEGASGAFVRELLRKAALIAADEGIDDLLVEDRHIDQALRELVVDGGALTRSLLGARMDANG